MPALGAATVKPERSIRLARLCTGEITDTLTLSYDLRQKSRHRVQLDSGHEAAVLLPHGSWLCEGDRLRTSDGGLVQVHAAEEEVSTVRTDDPVPRVVALGRLSLYGRGSRPSSLRAVSPNRCRHRKVVYSPYPRGDKSAIFHNLELVELESAERGWGEVG